MLDILGVRNHDHRDEQRPARTQATLRPARTASITCSMASAKPSRGHRRRRESVIARSVSEAVHAAVKEVASPARIFYAPRWEKHAPTATPVRAAHAERERRADRRAPVRQGQAGRKFGEGEAHQGLCSVTKIVAKRACSPRDRRQDRVGLPKPCAWRWASGVACATVCYFGGQVFSQHRQWHEVPRLSLLSAPRCRSSVCSGALTADNVREPPSHRHSDSAAIRTPGRVTLLCLPPKKKSRRKPRAECC